MSCIVIQVFPNDTHPLSLSMVPTGDISAHVSVAVHDKTLDNSNCSITHDTSLKI